MLENENSLLPVSPERGRKLRVVCLGDEAGSLDELERLLGTLEIEPVGRILSHSKKIHPATYVGQGKVEEAKELLEEKKADAVIVDFELSPNQLRNVEAILGKPIVDRPGVILEIFSQHARTKESKTQVELARLQYLLPRLAHFWTHFERQRGGGSNRGMGERQIEVDRRLVKRRMTILKDRLSEIVKERDVLRKGREAVLKVALVGYTNAGKSTLLNALTQSSVRAEDKLFATLDPSVRSLDPNCHPPVVAIDTVGFIDRLPTSLVASFRSTLEEVHQADLLLHVVDAGAENARAQIEVTESVLKELGAETKPRMLVMNKIDQVPEGGLRNEAKILARTFDSKGDSKGGVVISALNREDVLKLRESILDYFRSGLELWEIVVPYAESKLEAAIHAHGVVEVTRHLEKGTFFRVRMEAGWAKKLELKKYQP